MHVLGALEWGALLRSRAVAYAVTALALAYLALRIPIASLVEAFRTCDVRWVAAAAALVPLNLAFQAAKWRFVLRAGGLRAPWRDVWRSLMGGLALGALTPWRIGDLARGALLPGGNVAAAALLTVVDRTANFIALMLMGAIGALWLLEGVPMVAVMATVVACGWGWRWPGPLVRTLRRMAALTRWGEPTGRAIGLLSGFTWRERQRLLLWAVAFVAVWSVQFLLLVRAWGPFDLALGALAVPAMFVVRALIPAPAGGFGVREALAVVFLGACGAAPISAALAATALFVLNVALPAVLAAPVVLRRTWHRATFSTQKSRPLL